MGRALRRARRLRRRARCTTSARSRCSRSRGSGLDVGVLYWLGVAAVAALLGVRALAVRPGDLRRLDAAFFTVNGVISIVFFAFVRWTRRR